MSRWLLRVGLAIVLGSLAGRATAQQPGPIRPVVHEMGQSQAPQVPQPMGQYPVSQAAPCAGQPGEQEKPQPQGSWLSRQCTKCLNSVGLGCAASHDTLGCGSCYAHYIFVFGSCRQFFGEPCFPWGPDTLPGHFGGAAGAGGGGGCSKCGW
jgi:hypothetical protein